MDLSINANKSRNVVVLDVNYPADYLFEDDAYEKFSDLLIAKYRTSAAKGNSCVVNILSDVAGITSFVERCGLRVVNSSAR